MVYPREHQAQRVGGRAGCMMVLTTPGTEPGPGHGISKGTWATATTGWGRNIDSCPIDWMDINGQFNLEET